MYLLIEIRYNIFIQSHGNYIEVHQCLSQDLETGCPKLSSVTFLGDPVVQGRPQHIQNTTINMYLLIEIRCNILIQSHGNYIKVK